MPIYRYQDNRGNIVEMIRPVAERDEPVMIGKRRYRRLTAPERVAVCIGGPAPDPLRAQAIKGYQRLENEHGTRFRSEHSTATIRRTWKI
jgi:hypothetical protein